MDLDFSKKEKKILKFWKDNDVFRKSVNQRKKNRSFVFYEGPPTANGRPGIHHVESRVFKDIICRYKTMRGFRVERKAGWDTHGLPVELEVEKKLGLKNKKEIETYGIGKFNKKCRESVWQYLKEWQKLTERIGFWVDLENPYITYKNEYIESVWSILKEIYKRRLLFFGYKVVPYCSRCGTGLSSHEVAQGYERVKEPSIYVKLRIKNPEFKNSSLLVWTTTPWTLPGNVAVAVNPDIVYAKVKTDAENLILAKSRMEAAGLKDAEILQEFKGKELLEIYYEAPYPIESQSGVTIYKTIPAEFVSLKEGTGLVHIAPAFGIDDMEVIKAQNLKLRKQDLPEFPILLTVNETGRFTLDAKKWAGMFVKEADPLIIEDLKASNILFKEELYEHDYPFCWRCKSPLLYYAKQSWFINMQEVKGDLIKNNQKINWVPSHLKDGRFGEWLNEVKDWAVSRERYWATPLPVWKCKKCQNTEVIGSLNDLLLQRYSNNEYIILRHGESLRQITNLAMCWPENSPCSLTEKGKREVSVLAEKLKDRKIDLIISSDLQRTRQTAEIIAGKTGAKVLFDKRLREINVGIFNGKEPKLAWDYLDKQKNRFTSKFPRGESLNDMRKRAFNFLKDADAKYKSKNILIVSHEILLTVLELTLKGWPIDRIINWRDKNRKDLIKTAGFKQVEFKNLPYDEKLELDFHRPYIDAVKFYCQKCGDMMERTLEVMDCWFDSGSMPFAQSHWPLNTFDKLSASVVRDKTKKNQKLVPPELFPADYISEGIDQTRGWFYTLLAISTLLGYESSYRNVISLGHVLDEKGEKMSKSKGNIVNPWDIIEKYGIDATRWYFYTINQPGEPKLFAEKDIDGALKKFILTFWNCYIFWETYKVNLKTKTPNLKLNLLDKWIISRFNGLVREISDKLDNYDITLAARTLEKFVIEDLSLWYIRRSRRRFQRPENTAELKTASAVLGGIIFELTKLLAPFVPFLADEIYQKVKNLQPKVKISVHLDDWTKTNQKLINENLEKKMDVLREIITLALSERAKAGIKVRQPLQKLKIKNEKLMMDGELLDLLKEEINVKEIVYDDKIPNPLELDTEITQELKEEGIIREAVRNIQEMRKKSNLKPKDVVSVRYWGALNLENVLEKNEKIILREGKIKNIQKGEKKGNLSQTNIKVENEILSLAIKKA